MGLVGSMGVLTRSLTRSSSPFFTLRSWQTDAPEVVVEVEMGIRLPINAPYVRHRSLLNALVGVHPAGGKDKPL